VLVLAPHQDDETLGCGGTLALHRQQGDPVRVLFLTDGAAGDPHGYYPPDRYVEIRQAEARRAGAALGVDDLEFWPLPDGKLAGVGDLDERLRAAIRRFQPDILYYPSSRELHPDHWVAGAEVERLHGSGALASQAYAYEVWMTVEPTHVIDVSAVLARKEVAIAEYESQLRYQDYRAKILGLNAYRTIALPGPATAAEAFARLS
jgi:LmbE family N-acetylglucosaminyl deacetylase